jgi:hypothetical protein
MRGTRQGEDQRAVRGQDAQSMNKLPEVVFAKTLPAAGRPLTSIGVDTPGCRCRRAQ